MAIWGINISLWFGGFYINKSNENWETLMDNTVEEGNNNLFKN